MTISLKQIKIVNFLFILVVFILWMTFFKIFFEDESLRHSEKFISSYPAFISGFLLNVFAFIISLKTKPQKGTLLFALFLSLVSGDFALQYLNRVSDTLMPMWMLYVSFALAGTVFMKSLQIFPKVLTSHDINTVFKWRILSAYTKWSLNRYTWIVYPIIIFIAGYVSSYSKTISVITDALLNIGILITGVLFLYAAYKRSTYSERNKILWLFWGVVTYSFLTIIALSIRVFNQEMSLIVRLTIISLMSASLTLSMVMCLFFSDTFDTGIIVRRTIVDGSIFTIIVILYNTIEHYFLHWISHELHLSNVLVSSFLSGIFVMIFSPVHHKLMHFIERKIKKNTPHNAEI